MRANRAVAEPTGAVPEVADLESVRQAELTPRPATEGSQSKHHPLLWLSVAAVAAAVAIVVGVLASRLGTGPTSVGTGRPLRFTEAAPENTTFVSGGVLSPNGRYLGRGSGRFSPARPNSG